MTARAPTRMAELRAASRAMLDGLSPEAQRRQSHPELSPLLWHVGHVFFVENYWLAERVFDQRETTDAWRTLYFPELARKGDRGARLPDARELRAWTEAVAAENDTFWQRSTAHDHPLLEGGYLDMFLRQHYAQHLETMRLARDQLRYADAGERPASAVAPAAPSRDARRVPSQPVTIGTATVDAYDNEQPAFETAVEAFEIARQPVTNAEWLGFMAAGGYHEPHFWDPTGWAWREAGDIAHPQHWTPCVDGAWHIPAELTHNAHNAHNADIADQPVHGIGWREARAFARYAGARLPREIEWEAACRSGALDGLHQVWEWCDEAFHPYAGFRAFPYDGYSMPWFDGAHFVARGGSRHTEAEIRRPGFRNFYPPGHRHVRAGLRLAW